LRRVLANLHVKARVGIGALRIEDGAAVFVEARQLGGKADRLAPIVGGHGGTDRG